MLPVSYEAPEAARLVQLDYARQALVTARRTGTRAPLSANIPASLMNPGSTTETPMPWGARSSRIPSANPRNPNLLAE